MIILRLIKLSEEMKEVILKVLSDYEKKKFISFLI